MTETLVLGLGNILLGDEGVGVRVIECLLERHDFPEGVRVVDGGTLGLELLPYVEDASRLLVVDAVHARNTEHALRNTRHTEQRGYSQCVLRFQRLSNPLTALKLRLKSVEWAAQ